MHRVVSGTGDEQPAVGRDGHVVRADADAQFAKLPALFRVHHAHAARTPVAYVKMLLVGAEDTRVGMLSHGDCFLEGERLLVEHEDRVVGLVTDMELSVPGMHRDAGDEESSMSV